MLNKIINLTKKRRVSFANRVVFDATIVGGELGDKLKKLGNAIVENDAAKEEVVLQNIAASKSRFITTVEGNA